MRESRETETEILTQLITISLYTAVIFFQLSCLSSFTHVPSFLKTSLLLLEALSIKYKLQNNKKRFQFQLNKCAGGTLHTGLTN